MTPTSLTAPAPRFAGSLLAPLTPVKVVVEPGELPTVVPFTFGEAVGAGAVRRPVAVCRVPTGFRRTQSEAEVLATEIALRVNAFDGLVAFLARFVTRHNTPTGEPCPCEDCAGARAALDAAGGVP